MKTNIRRGVAVAATVAAMAGASFGLAGTASAATISPAVGVDLNVPGTSQVTSRVAGVDREDTALKAALNLLTADNGVAYAASGTTAPAITVKPGALVNGAVNVYITRDDDYADALSVGPLSAANHGIVLVTPTGTLDPRVNNLLKALKASASVTAGVQVTIAGGNKAVSDDVVTSLATTLGTNDDGTAKTPGTAGGEDSITRIQGADRYATSLAIAKSLTQTTAAGVTTQHTGDVLLATGRDFADALSAGAAAAHDTNSPFSPVILTDGSNALSADAQAFIAARTANNVAKGGPVVYAVGGAAAAAAPSAVALNGADRFETAVKVANQFWTIKSTDVDTINVGLASGTTFADAMIGANFLAQDNGGSPLLLTDPANLSDATSTYLNTNRGAINHAYVFGGTGTITFDVNVQAAKALFI